jgi:oligopeptidase A
MFEEFNVNDLESKKEILEVKLKESKEQIDKLLQIEKKSYDNFVKPYQEIGEGINIFLTPIFHIDSVKNSKITTKVYEECLPLISNYETELSQNVNIYTSLKDIQDNYKDTLNDIQKKVLENEIRDFELSGCHLNNN